MKENENLDFKLIQEAILRERISTIIEIGKMEGETNLNGNAIQQLTETNSPSQETSQSIQNIPESISRLTEDSSNLSLTKNIGERNYSSSNWIFLKEVNNNAELETLRCINGVARNRTLIHGIRYACTKTRNKRRFL
uniref:Uncharacterized protein n=1 Tax=Meloidogyne enterolobii TaxID=390850 RepID=A0A6V7X6B1_MELEN|nr:unnamed protein product [Meloidogyne enterolobii]